MSSVGEREWRERPGFVVERETRVRASVRKALLKKFARVLADKWEKPLSVTTNYVVTKVSFAVVKATHNTIFGARTRSGLGPCPITEADRPLGPKLPT